MHFSAISLMLALVTSLEILCIAHFLR